MTYIKTVHAKNKELIKKYRIKKGTEFLNIHTGKIETVDYIHVLYGWIKTTAGDKQKLPQSVEEALKNWRIL